MHSSKGYRPTVLEGDLTEAEDHPDVIQDVLKGLDATETGMHRTSTVCIQRSCIRSQPFSSSTIMTVTSGTSWRCQLVTSQWSHACFFDAKIELFFRTILNQ